MLRLPALLLLLAQPLSVGLAPGLALAAARSDLTWKVDSRDEAIEIFKGGEKLLRLVPEKENVWVIREPNGRPIGLLRQDEEGDTFLIKDLNNKKVATPPAGGMREMATAAVNYREVLARVADQIPPAAKPAPAPVPTPAPEPAPTPKEPPVSQDGRRRATNMRAIRASEAGKGWEISVNGDLGGYLEPWGSDGWKVLDHQRWRLGRLVVEARGKGSYTILDADDNNIGRSSAVLREMMCPNGKQVRLREGQGVEFIVMHAFFDPNSYP